MSIIIWLTWLPWTGKWILLEYLMSNFNWKEYSTSDVIRDLLNNEKKPLTRQNLRQKANELRNSFWPWILAREVLKKINNCKINFDVFLVDGIRNPAEVIAFQNNGNFFLIWIDSDIDVLVDRIIDRWRFWETDKDEIKENIIKEKKWIWWKNAQRPYDCLKLWLYREKQF
jgi:deoxyadenosine/deoxycytidine kinase